MAVKKNAGDTMILSEETLAIFKHFASINPSIMVLPEDVENGKTKIYSRSETRAMIGFCIIPEEFKKPFITTDLARFLSMASLFDHPVFEFEEDYVLIREEGTNQKVTFYNSPKHLVEKGQANKLPNPKAIGEVVIEFSLSEEVMERVKKAGDMLGNDDILIKVKDGKLKISALNKRAETTNSFEIEVPAKCTDDMEFYFKKSNLRARPNDYLVKVYSEGLMEMVSQSDQFEVESYWVVSEIDDND